MELFIKICIDFVEVTLGGLSVGSIYAVVAVGFVLIYRATDVLNFAQGELMMVGIYFCFYLMTRYHIPFLLAFLLTLIFSAVLGFLLELIFLRKLHGKPVFTMVMVTIALSILLKSVTMMLLGQDTHVFPRFIGIQPVHLLGISVLPISLLIVASVILLLVMLFFFFKYSNIGLAMRATAEDYDAAKMMGIETKKIFGLAWSISAVVAAIGGILYVQGEYVYPDIGYIGLKSFPAAILGGLDSILGALFGGLVIGVMEYWVGAYLEPFLGGGVKELVAFTLLILILMIKPYGFFGTEEIEKV